MTCKYYSGCLHVLASDKICTEEPIDRVVNCPHYHEYSAIEQNGFPIFSNVAETIRKRLQEFKDMPIVDFSCKMPKEEYSNIKVIDKKIRYICKECNIHCIFHAKKHKELWVPYHCPVDETDAIWTKQVKVKGKWKKAT